MASKQQRDAERRRLQRQSQRRREADQRRRRINLIVSVVAVIAVVGVVIGLVVATSGNDDPAPSASKSGHCTWTKSGTASKPVSVPATTSPPATGTAKVDVTTNRGSLVFALDRAKAPCAVASFLSLAKQKYFDSTSCHRLTSGSLNVLQCGDPTGSGSGGPGYKFADELTGTETYTTGVLAMANAGKNTNGSQFFIVYKASQLDANYTVFGRVSSGLGVVTAVAAKGVKGGGGDGPPAEPVTLTKVAAAS